MSDRIFFFFLIITSSCSFLLSLLPPFDDWLLVVVFLFVSIQEFWCCIISPFMTSALMYPSTKYFIFTSPPTTISNCVNNIKWWTNEYYCYYDTIIGIITSLSWVILYSLLLLFVLYPHPHPQFSFLNPQSSILNSQSSILHSPFSILNLQSSIIILPITIIISSIIIQHCCSNNSSSFCFVPLWIT